ncbi:MAG: hypothetical protein OXI48_04400 [bacterium]|nr:hypothetical protein [bacterium]
MRMPTDSRRLGLGVRRGIRNPARTRFSRLSVGLLGVLGVLLVAAVLADAPGGGVVKAASATELPDGGAPSLAGSASNAPAGESAAPAVAPGADVQDDAAPSEAAGGAPAEPPRRCLPRFPSDPQVSDPSPAAVAVELSRAMYDCASEVGLAFATDAEAIAALLSRGLGGPLLLVDGWFDDALIGEIVRLAPERIVLAGFHERILPRSLAGLDVEPVPVDPSATVAPDVAGHDRLWIVDDADAAAALAALGHPIGVGAVAVSGDFRAASPEIRARIAAAAEVELLSNFGEDAAWQLEVVRRGEELPGGGLLMFDIDPARRLVAMYGHPASSGLGVLGEQGAAAGVERLKQIVVGYGEDGARVVPTFEIITTVASAHPGPDGDYSSETARDVIRPWIEIAAANEMYVVLDLQPGRTDFLTQAKIYEEFLRLPHVGLALDPEWRLKPHQVHMRQVGTVDAAEINQVSEWLAALVRREALPQKLVVLHQFEWKMITNRHLIETPPELAVLIHMDGFGTQGVKQSTWNVLTAAPDADKFWWGWKNFYDEDTPTARPDRVLGLTPPALFVSYQ